MGASIVDVTGSCGRVNENQIIILHQWHLGHLALADVEKKKKGQETGRKSAN